MGVVSGWFMIFRWCFRRPGKPLNHMAHG